MAQGLVKKRLAQKALAKKILDKMTLQAGRPALVTPLGPGNWPSPYAFWKTLSFEDSYKYLKAHTFMILIDNIDRSISGRWDRFTVESKRWILIFPKYEEHRPTTKSPRPISSVKGLQRKWELMKAEMLKLIDKANSNAERDGRLFEYMPGAGDWLIAEEGLSDVEN